MIRFNNKLLRVIAIDNSSGPVTEDAETVVTVGTQYGWKVPIDLVLDWANNGLYMVITAYTTQTDMDSWDYASDNRFFAVKYGTNTEYNILNGFVNFIPFDSSGYRGMTFTNTDFSNANLSIIQNWKNDGVEYVVFHAPASSTSKFVSPPLCVLHYNGNIQIITPMNLAKL